MLKLFFYTLLVFFQSYVIQDVNKEQVNNLLDKQVIVIDIRTDKEFKEGTRMLIKDKKKYDLIFIDPPYSYFDDKTLNGIIRTALKLSPPGGIIICEHPKEEKIILDVENRVKEYKDKFITFCWQN